MLKKHDPRPEDLSVDDFFSRIALTLTSNPFMAEFSRNINKFPSYDVDTMAVTYCSKLDEIQMYWNPAFLKKQTSKQTIGVIQHEFYHVIFGHLVSRRREPHQLWNISTDLAINSIIVASDGRDALPKECLLPGEAFPPKPPEDNLHEKIDKGLLEKIRMRVSKLIETFPQKMASEWYFNLLIQDEELQSLTNEMNELLDSIAQEIVDSMGSPGGGGGDSEGNGNAPNGKPSFSPAGGKDDHSSWNDVPEDLREAIEQRIRGIIAQSARHADCQANGWGNMPAEICQDIRAYAYGVIDWRAVLRQFIGSVLRGGKTQSIKRINKKYPYIHPGKKIGHTAKLLIAIDQSGSVNDELLSLFFGELNNLTRRTTIDILPFDCEADEKQIWTWRKGKKIEGKRERCGGTDFNAPTNIVNDPKNNGRWDGMLILTDGLAPRPDNSRIKRGWVIGPNDKLMFGETDEMVINASKNSPVKGSWR